MVVNGFSQNQPLPKIALINQKLFGIVNQRGREGMLENRRSNWPVALPLFVACPLGTMNDKIPGGFKTIRKWMVVA